LPYTVSYTHLDVYKRQINLTVQPPLRTFIEGYPHFCFQK